MAFNRKLPLQVGIVERRKAKKKKFYVISLLLVVLVASAFVYLNDSLRGKIVNSVFMQAPTPVTNSSGKTAGSGTEGNRDKNPSSKGTTQKGTSSPTPVAVKKDENLSLLKKSITDYTKRFKGTYGVYYINLVDGTRFGINDTSQYFAASTVKVPVNLYLFTKIQEGKIDPKMKMTYTKSDYEGGTGSIQYKSLGTRYTVRELSKLSIEVSDNVAINMIIRLLGRQNYKNFMKKLGGKVVTERNYSCPKDMALYMKKVYEFYQKYPTLGGELIGYLENTIFNDRIPKLLPKGTRIAHKIGNYVGALHDVGIVFTDKPYAVAIMTKNIYEKESYDVIASISRKVYDYNTGNLQALKATPTPAKATPTSAKKP